MSRWARSWAITRMSFAVLSQDKEMIWFPILSGLFSLLFSAALLFPTVILQLLSASGAGAIVFGPMQYVATGVSYFGLAFIATFFNVCTVYTTRVRLLGGDATFMDSIRFALSRVHLIAAWSLVSASVGLLLHLLESLANRLPVAGKIILWIVRTILAGVWSVITVFVVPSMVYRGIGPIDAIRDSVDTLKRTWGETVLGYFGIGIASVVCILPGVALVFGGIMAGGAAKSVLLAIACAGVGTLWILGVALVFGILSTIYRTALYHFASTGVAPVGFEEVALRGAFH
jgi:Family of unknown function (DUF6159)